MTAEEIVAKFGGKKVKAIGGNRHNYLVGSRVLGAWGSGGYWYVLIEDAASKAPISTLTWYQEQIQKKKLILAPNVDVASITGSPYDKKPEHVEVEEEQIAAPPTPSSPTGKKVIPPFPHKCRCGAPALIIGNTIDCSSAKCPQGFYKRGFADQDNHGTGLDLMGFPAEMLANRPQFAEANKKVRPLLVDAWKKGGCAWCGKPRPQFPNDRLTTCSAKCWDEIKALGRLHELKALAPSLMI